MEFPFDVSEVLQNGVTLWDRNKFSSLPPITKQKLSVIIDTMGSASAKAQKLGQVITTTPKFSTSDHRLYIFSSEKKVDGILRVGKKRLYVNVRFRRSSKN
jgi:hypothetical protein